MVRRFLAAKQVIPKTLPQPGYGHFLTPLRKVVVDYDPYAQHQDGVRYVYAAVPSVLDHTDL